MVPVESPPPAAAQAVFGSRLDLATRYAGLLAGAGIERGLIGPREVPRLWDRHLLNSAAISPVFPEGSRIVDVGTGAGLPGVVLAIARPDLRVDLVESLARRVSFLAEVVAILGLADQVRVAHGRAEDPRMVAEVGGAQWVTARAVAPLDRLVGWCFPLLSPGGTLVAIKGAAAAAEATTHQRAIDRLGGSTAVVKQFEVGGGEEPVTAVLVARERLSRSMKGRS